jgi:hypothetical protein
MLRKIGVQTNEYVSAHPMTSKDIEELDFDPNATTAIWAFWARSKYLSLEF